MDSRSDRDRSISPEPPPAARRRCRQRISSPSCDTEGADRISGLPDSALLRILAGVRCARTAAYAGGLSRRWRGLWRRLPEVHLHGLGPDAVVAALAQVALPELSVLDINVPKRFKFSAAGVASLLCTAARLAPVDLSIVLWVDSKDTDIAVELPCFDHAASIKLELGDVKLAPTAAGGEFPLLERLSVAGCRLSTVTLISQCPHLRVLELRRCVHPDVLRVHSMKIEELIIDGDADSWLGSVDIVAPVLKKFIMNTVIDKDFSMSFSAPMVEILSWQCRVSASGTVGINGLWSLSNLKLSRRKSGYILQLDINSPLQDRTPYARRLQEIVQLPDISVFKLRLLMWGDAAQRLLLRGDVAQKLCEHGFGSMVLNLLGMFTAIQSLKLETERIMMGMGYEAVEALGPNCHCDHPRNWPSQNITLTCLKEVEIKNFEASEDEVNLLKLMFGCAPLLKRVTLRVSPGISPRELEWKETCNLFKANPSVRPYVYDACGEKMEYNSTYNTMRFYDDDDDW